MLRPLAWYRELREARGRAREGCFLVEGGRALSQVLRCGAEYVQEVLLADGVEFGAGHGCPVRRLSRKQFGSVAPSRTPQGILGVVRIPAEAGADTLPEQPSDHVLVLEHVQDPGNVGTLIRDAAAFGFGGVVLSHKCADPFSPKCVQASAGTVLSVWVRRTARYLRLLDQLRERGLTVCAADSHAVPGIGFPSGPVALVLGNEGTGLTEEMLARADRRVMIAIDTARCESLNVAAAGAVLMFMGGRADGQVE